TRDGAGEPALIQPPYHGVDRVRGARLRGRKRRRMTSSPMPAFTLQAVRERVRELRDIVGGALQRFADDIERDRQTLERHLDVPRWLWVPHESGTELAPLVPHGKRWAADVARRCRFGLARVPTPYLLTPERV